MEDRPRSHGELKRRIEDHGVLAALYGDAMNATAVFRLTLDLQSIGADGKVDVA
jgi:hypothetical protein